jgi:nicotinamide mononucleotide adenylyltransferase
MGSAASTRDMSASPSPEPSATPVEYEFPREKLKRRLEKPNKTPLVLVACGSFSPPTELHLQMFELAQKHIDETDFEIVGNYMSPCSDSYGKSSLVPAHHRINM